MSSTSYVGSAGEIFLELLRVAWRGVGDTSASSYSGETDLLFLFATLFGDVDSLFAGDPSSPFIGDADVGRDVEALSGAGDIGAGFSTTLLRVLRRGASTTITDAFLRGGIFKTFFVGV